MAAVCSLAAATQQPLVRWPAVAGLHYPADPETLLQTVKRYFEEADVPEPADRLLACIAPSGPYGLAGRVAAHAFKTLSPGQYERVIVIAPGHGPMFENCSVPAVDVFLTPLGPVALDAPAIRHLLYSPLFTAHQLSYAADHLRSERIHEFEFAIETVLPFLQERLWEFKLVPILIGDLRDPDGRVRDTTLAAVANAIRPIVNERTLIVISANFTLYGNEYGNVPFTENIIANIERLDRKAFEAVLAKDVKGFRAYLDETRNVVDGKDAIPILLHLLPEDAVARILDYELSAALTGKEHVSVSYAAFTFSHPDLPPLTAQPDKVRPLVLRRPSGAPSADAPVEQAPQQPQQETPDGNEEPQHE